MKLAVRNRDLCFACHELCSLLLPQVTASHVCVCRFFTDRPHWPWDDKNKMCFWKPMTSSSHCKKHYAHCTEPCFLVWFDIILSIFDPPLCMSRINLSLSLWQPQQNLRVAMRIFVFLKTSLDQTQSKKKILTTDTQLFKENTKSLSLSNCCHAFISLIYKTVLHGCSLNAQINTDSHL